MKRLKEDPRPKGGRPPAISEKDLKWVEEVAALGLTIRAIASKLGLDESTVHGYLQDHNHPVYQALERGKRVAHAAVAQSLWGKAVSGDVAAIRWYEMSRMRMTDKVELHGQDGGPIKVAVAQVEPAMIKALAQRVLELEEDPELAE